ncbi:MAG: NAD(P)-binding domain-containing protein, partial [Balneolaceae bacterium]|nr:NAD(P)-binding domain-containing protein [Balneolaceae bacterium]
MLHELLQKIERKDFTIGIIGLGYVGLPLMWTFHKNGMPVMGFDIDQDKIDCLKEGRPYIKHLGSDMMQTLAGSDRADATADFDRLPEADALLLCVPTPLDDHREPDMEYVEKTSLTVGDHLREGQLVILESTTYPGTTEELIIPILESKSGLTAGEDFYVAYSPDGKRIASAGGDRTVRIWDAGTGDELLALIHPADVGRVLPGDGSAPSGFISRSLDFALTG